MARESRRITLWVPLPLLGALQERASVSKLTLSDELRRAAERGLDLAKASDPAATSQLQLIAMATLVATEHVIRFLGRSFPDGERRLLELKEAAAEAAEMRLEELKGRLDGAADQ